MTTTALVPTVADVPAVLAAAGNRARVRAWEFFAANISNPNTREAYSRAVSDFCAWLEVRGLVSIADLQTLHVAAFIRELTGEFSVPTVKQRLAAIRAFLDWLVTGGILPFNPAAAVRGPKHSTKRGKTTVLSGAEARRILDAIPDTTPAGLPDLGGLRDRALIGLMVYSFARIGAAVGMRRTFYYAAAGLKAGATHGWNERAVQAETDALGPRLFDRSLCPAERLHPA